MRFQNFEIYAKYDITPMLNVCAMYSYTMASFNTTAGKSNPYYQMVRLMTDYFLSKRTDLYMPSVYQQVGGDRTLAYVRVLMAFPPVGSRPVRA
ncbi:hypothetical protein PQR25_19600 [Paraburkholderia nemoris]|uniref:hypothetical protein n=1 Tax=Paraburkholderia nemoris TaxID=2793076 RepID=UPI0038B754D8